MSGKAGKGAAGRGKEQEKEPKLQAILDRRRALADGGDGASTPSARHTVDAPRTETAMTDPQLQAKLERQKAKADAGPIPSSEGPGGAGNTQLPRYQYVCCLPRYHCARLCLLCRLGVTEPTASCSLEPGAHGGHHV